MRVHIDKLPRVALRAKPLGFEVGHRVAAVPFLSLDGSDIVYRQPERPNLVVSNTRKVFFHAFTKGLKLYEATGSHDDIIVYNPDNTLESSQWNKQIFYAVAHQGFALFKALDESSSSLKFLKTRPYVGKRDDTDGEVWLEIHVEFRAGPGQTVIGQRRRINKNTGEIELGQTFVQPIDVALESYAELGRAIEDVLNPTPDQTNVVKLPMGTD